jgi:hypothetical protein
MSQVYENCMLTISATKSETSISGFLQPLTVLRQELGAYHFAKDTQRALFVGITQVSDNRIMGPSNDRG